MDFFRNLFKRKPNISQEDLLNLRQEIHEEISRVQNASQEDLLNLRQEIHEEISRVKVELGNTWEKRLKDFEGRIQKLEDSVNKSSQTTLVQSQSYADLKLAFDNQSRDNSALKKQIFLQEQRFSDLEKQNTEWKRQLKDLQNQLDQAQSPVVPTVENKAVQADIVELKKSLNNLLIQSKSYAALKLAFDNQSRDNSALKEQIFLQEQRFSNLEKQNSEWKRQLKDLQNQLDQPQSPVVPPVENKAVQADIVELKKSLNNLLIQSKSYADLKLAFDNQSRDNSALKEQISDLEKQNSEWERQLKNLQNQLDQLKSKDIASAPKPQVAPQNIPSVENKAVQADIVELKKNLLTQSQSYAALKLAFDNQSRDNSALKEQISNLEKQNSEWERQLKDLQNQLDQAQSPVVPTVENKAVQADIAELKNSLLTQSQSYEDLKLAFDNQLRDNSALKEQIFLQEQRFSDLEKQNSEWERQLKDLQNQLDQLKSKDIASAQKPQAASQNIIWIKSFSLVKSKTPTAYFHGAGAAVKSKLSQSIQDMDGLITYLSQSKIEEPARTSFMKNLRWCMEALNKLYCKFDFEDCDEEELSEEITSKFFKIISENLLDNVLVAIYRGGKDATDHQEFLKIVNSYLTKHGIYTEDIVPGMSLERDMLSNIEPPIAKRTSVPADDGKVDEVELLPYFMVYEDDDGNLDTVRKRGRIVRLKYGA